MSETQIRSLNKKTQPSEGFLPWEKYQRLLTEDNGDGHKKTGILSKYIYSTKWREKETFFFLLEYGEGGRVGLWPTGDRQSPAHSPCGMNSFTVLFLESTQAGSSGHSHRLIIIGSFDSTFYLFWLLWSSGFEVGNFGKMNHAFCLWFHSFNSKNHTPHFLLKCQLFHRHKLYLLPRSKIQKDRDT